MNTQTPDRPDTDDLDLIELGSVSEETRGIPGVSDEYNLGSPLSRD